MVNIYVRGDKVGKRERQTEGCANYCDESVEGRIAAYIDNENTLRKRKTHVNELIYIFTH